MGSLRCVVALLPDAHQTRYEADCDDDLTTLITDRVQIIIMLPSSHFFLPNRFSMAFRSFMSSVAISTIPKGLRTRADLMRLTQLWGVYTYWVAFCVSRSDGSLHRCPSTNVQARTLCATLDHVQPHTHIILKFLFWPLHELYRTAHR